MVANCVKGVTDGFKKELEINGVGYRAQLQGNVLKLNLGLSHDVNFDIPSDVTAVPKQTEITVEGIDHNVLAKLRRIFVNGVSLSHIKAKVLCTKASISSAKKARRRRT